MKNFHLPLPEDTYEALKAEAKLGRVPATSMARHAIRAWLEARRKARRKDAIAKYATAMAGTEFDLDAGLEGATLELLRRAESHSRSRVLNTK